MGATCTSSNSRPDADHEHATNRGSSWVQAMNENNNDGSLVYELLIQQLLEHRIRDLLRQREAHSDVVNEVVTKDTAPHAEAVGKRDAAVVGGVCTPPMDFSPLSTLIANLECKMAAVLANSTSNPTGRSCERVVSGGDHKNNSHDDNRNTNNNNTTTISNNISPRNCDFPTLDDDFSRASSSQTPRNTNNTQGKDNDGLGRIRRDAPPGRQVVDHKDKSSAMSNGIAQSRKRGMSAPKARPKVPPRAKPLPSSSSASTSSPATGALLSGAKRTKEGKRPAGDNHLKFAERFEIGKDYLDQLRKLIHAADDDDMKSDDVNNRYTNNLYAAGKGSDWWGKGSAEPIRTNTVCLDPELLAQDSARGGGGAGGVGRLGGGGGGFVAADGAASDRLLWGGGGFLAHTMSGEYAAAAAQHNNNCNNSSVFSPLQSYNGGITATMPFGASSVGRSPTVAMGGNYSGTAVGNSLVNIDTGGAKSAIGGSPATNALLAGGDMMETNAPPPALQLMTTSTMGNENNNCLPNCVPPEQSDTPEAVGAKVSVERGGGGGGEAALTEQLSFTPSASVQFLKRVQQQKERSMHQRSTNGAASATSPAVDWLGFSGLMPNNDTASAGAGVLLGDGQNANTKSPAQEPLNLEGMQPVGMSRGTGGQQEAGQHSSSTYTSSPSIPLAGSLAAFKEAKARAKALLEGQASSGTYSNADLKGGADNANKGDEGAVDAGQPLQLGSIRRVSSSFSHPLLNAVTATSSDKPSTSSFSLAAVVATAHSPAAPFAAAAAALPTDVTKAKTRNGSTTASESARCPSPPSITRADIPISDRTNNDHRLSIPSTLVGPYPPQLGVKATLSNGGSERKKYEERRPKVAESPKPPSAQPNQKRAVGADTDVVTLTLTRAELTVLAGALSLLKK